MKQIFLCLAFCLSTGFLLANNVIDNPMQLFTGKQQSSIITSNDNAQKAQRTKAFNTFIENTYKLKLDSLVATSLDTTTNIISGLKITNIYDKEKVIKQIYFLRENESSPFTITNTNNFSYDSIGHISTKISSYYNGSTISSQNKYQNKYDSNGLLTSTYYSTRNDSSSSWNTQSKNEFYYTNNALTKEIDYTTSNSVDRTIFHYHDSYGNDTLIKTYDASKHLIDKIIFKFTYSLSGKKSTEEKHDISSSDSTHVQDIFSWEKIYDQYENVVSYKSYMYNSYNNKYDYLAKLSFNIDFSELMSNVLGYEYMEIPVSFYNKPNEFIINSYADKFIGKYSFYYSDFGTTSNTNAINEDNIKFITLNPTTDQIQFNLPQTGTFKFMMFNLAGTKVIEQSIMNNETISLNTLSKGIFLYRISGYNKNIQGKLFVK